jgi:hypothetical protein
MLSPQALFRGLVQRALPSFNADSANTDVAATFDPYGRMYTQPLVRKAHNLADEGSYWVTNNAQTAIAPTYGTAFAALNPFITIYNANATQRAYLDYAALAAIVAGACTTTVGYIAFAALIDSGNRYSSGGSNLTANIVNPNGAAPGGNGSGLTIWCGAITASAAVNPRVIVGLRNLRPGVSTTVINVVGDMHLLNFGGVEGAVGSIVAANANIMPQALPPIIIGPGQTALLYIWFPVMSAPSAATFAPELGLWVR